MTTQNVVVTLSTSQDVGDLSFANWGDEAVDRIVRLIAGVQMGSFTSSIDAQLAPAYAYGVLVVSGGAGADGGTIGGKLVTATFATSDANTSDLIAAAVLADTTANKFVSATSRAATGTVTIASGAGLTTATFGGILGNPDVTASVTWATSDTVTAAALAAAINALINCPVVASSAAGVVTVYATTAGTGTTNTGGNSVTLAGSGTGVTVSGAKLTNGGTSANVLIKALVPGTVGLGVTLVASGTGVTAPSGANLVGGLGAPGNSYAS